MARTNRTPLGFLYRRAFSYIKDDQAKIWLALGVSILLSLTSLIATYSFLPVFEIVFGNGTIGTVQTDSGSLGARIQSSVTGFYHTIAGEGPISQRLGRLVAVIVILTALTTLLRALVDYLFIAVQANGNRKLRRASFHHLCALPMSYFVRHKGGAILSRLTNDIGGTISMVTQSIAQVVINVVLTVTFFLLLLYVQPRLTGIIVPILFIAGGGMVLIGRWTKQNRTKILALQADVFSIIQEFISGIKIIKGLSGEEFEKRRWERSIKSWQKLEIWNALNKVLPLRVNELIIVIASAAVMIAGGGFIERGELTAPELLLFVVMLTRFQASANELSKIWFNLQDGRAYAERAFDLIDTPVQHDLGTRSAPTLTRQIEFRNVSLNYGEGDALQDISFTLPKGAVVALVGSSGSGKSSIASLLIRLFEPTQGTIVYDGVNIREFDLRSYRAQFGIVTQDTFLFHDSIRNNIIYALERSVSETEIIAAATTAHADEFITALSAGYDTVIGDRGARLSGGQQQRLAIARAILRNPSVLILDEATSSLDSHSERQVQSAIQTALKGRTALIIAHRLSTIMNADLILVVHEGHIVERGTHQQLLQQHGLYKHMWDLQSL